MQETEKLLLGLDAAVVFIGACFLALSARLAIRSSRELCKAVDHGEKYQDGDGIATEETEKRFSVFWQNVLIFTITSAGFVLSLVEAILAEVNKNWNPKAILWLDLAFWFILWMQMLLLCRQRKPVTRFRIAAAESVSLVVALLYQIVRVYLQIVRETQLVSRPQESLDWVKFAFTISGLIVCLSYPRRPDLFLNGKPIDSQLTTNTWSRITWAWADPILALARVKKLVHDDLPLLDHANRAGDLLEQFNKQKKRDSLIPMLIYSTLPGLIRQQICTVLDAFFNIAPQFALFQLLLLMEARDAGFPIAKSGAFWVVAFGLLQMIAGYIQSRCWWYSEACVQIPLRLELGALIFAKSMRKKDVKGAPKKKVSNENPGKATKDADSEDDEAGAMRQSRQGVVNLVGVDANRIGNFATVNHIMTGSVLRLFVALYFLKRLVGWPAMLVGIAVNLLFLPLNIYFSKRYTSFQDILMKARDKKLAVIKEALSGIRQIKFSALEHRWQKKILDTREHEIETLWGVLYSDVVLIGMWITGPMLLSTACIATYSLINGRLEPSVAFTTVSILGKIEGTLSYLPELITNFLDAIVSVKRISEYLDAPEYKPVAQFGDKIAFEQATIAWPSDEIGPETFKLHDMNLEFPLGELSVISGRTGSGKSLLLSSILGECELLRGKITMPKLPSAVERNDQAAHRGNWLLPNAVAFVPQVPWIENASFKDNILFGLPFDESRYRQVLFSCSLEKDLEILTEGDETEIGPNGINLSGGQCWRLTLARALYSRAGILILDDIFSAVDAHVGRHIFENALTGEICKDRTRILVTHHVALCLPKAKYEVRLGKGGVEHASMVDGVDRSDILTLVPENEEAIVDDSDIIETTMDSEAIQRRLSTTSRRLSRKSTATGRRTSSAQRDTPSNANDFTDDISKKPDNPKKFVEDEKTQTGYVEFRIYVEYLKACGGWWFWLLVVLLFGVYEVLLLSRGWILNLWTRGQEQNAVLSTHLSHRLVLQNYLFKNTIPEVSKEQHSDGRLIYYLCLYLGVTLSMCLEGTFRYYFVFTGSIKASRIMFQRLTFAVLRAPLRWLDTMPVGRVLNRFTTDFNTFDTSLAYGFSFAFWNFLAVIGIMTAGAIVSPYIMISSVLLLVVSMWYAIYYLSGARETRRLEATAKSPIYELFNAALQGVSSIRAYDKTDDYVQNMFSRLDRHARCLYYLVLFKRWLFWRFQVVGTVFCIIVASILIGIKTMDASLGGFALTFTLGYNEALLFLVRHLTEVELGMNSTERIVEYSELEIEHQGGIDVPASWPSEGRLEVEKLVVGYAPELPPVLQGLNFEIKPRERVGVVGRTGAGKSSLTLALFRFLEAREGTVLIDGMDISKIKLQDLRSRLAIIPQDPVLFSGTVRSNLDPFDERSDLELQDALRRVQLIESEDSTHPESSSSTDGPGSRNINIFKSLSSAISEGGQNLSQGQRQLLCLARAIVARPKILVLDEATSAVDKTTDSLIQRSIREEFEDSTLLVIAHRLSTIVDFDQVLVLDQGMVVEYDTPKNLMARTDGVFKGMVESSGEREVLLDVITKQ